jgi:inner membrane protein
VDNVTHSLVGLFVADAVVLLRARRGAPLGAGFSGALATASVLANNIPDLDFLAAPLTGGKLGYLLQHRGYTHTLVAALPLSLVCLGMVTLVARAFGRRYSSRDCGWFWATALFGCLLHVAMDFGNNYGVHPFWPFDNHWYYADAIYIVDPWLIVTLAGVAIGGSESIVLRGLLLALLGVLLGLAWVSGLISPVIALVLSAYTLGWSAWMWHTTPARRIAAGALGCAGLAAILLMTRHVARESAARALAPDGDLRLIDLVSTPAPGNPLCWWIIALQRSNSRYVAREALASGWSLLWPVQRCTWPGTDSTAPLEEPTQHVDPSDARGLVWGPEYRAPLAELLEARRDDCVAAAFARFARVPFWIARAGRARLIGDLRYDRSSALDFAELRLSPQASCPRFVPPWEPPLDVLER